MAVTPGGSTAAAKNEGAAPSASSSTVSRTASTSTVRTIYTNASGEINAPLWRYENDISGHSATSVQVGNAPATSSSSKRFIDNLGVSPVARRTEPHQSTLRNNKRPVVSSSKGKGKQAGDPPNMSLNLTKHMTHNSHYVNKSVLQEGTAFSGKNPRSTSKGPYSYSPGGAPATKDSTRATSTTATGRALGDLRWAHGCNTRRQLRDVLRNEGDADIIEVDVTVGKLLRDGREKVIVDFPKFFDFNCVGARKKFQCRRKLEEEELGGSCSGGVGATSSGASRTTSRGTTAGAGGHHLHSGGGPATPRDVYEDMDDGEQLILCHFPYTKSDLSLAEFLRVLCEENDAYYKEKTAREVACSTTRASSCGHQRTNSANYDQGGRLQQGVENGCRATATEQQAEYYPSGAVELCRDWSWPAAITSSHWPHSQATDDEFAPIIPPAEAVANSLKLDDFTPIRSTTPAPADYDYSRQFDPPARARAATSGPTFWTGGRKNGPTKDDLTSGSFLELEELSTSSFSRSGTDTEEPPRRPDAPQDAKHNHDTVALSTPTARTSNTRKIALDDGNFSRGSQSTEKSSSSAKKRAPISSTTDGAAAASKSSKNSFSGTSRALFVNTTDLHHLALPEARDSSASTASTSATSDKTTTSGMMNGATSETDRDTDRHEDHVGFLFDNRSGGSSFPGEPTMSSGSLASDSKNRNSEGIRTGTNTAPPLSTSATSTAFPSSTSTKKRRLRPLGVKLDFKTQRALKPALHLLKKLNATARLPVVILNADVLHGPCSMSERYLPVLEAKTFVQMCVERCPEAVLSLSWLAGDHAISSRNRVYTDQMIEKMLGIVLFPLIDDGSGLIRSPANAARHITFAVCAQYAAASKLVFDKLLRHVPSASLTLYTGSWSRGITPEHLDELKQLFPSSRTFFDVRLRNGNGAAAR
ncbi:unnamed protein product [Amoebophrya sp. A120]|nr:unnamed protein product [Amoebophrya sp. A120]|eukprot:GSA120T00012645001.1